MPAWPQRSSKPGSLAPLQGWGLQLMAVVRWRRRQTLTRVHPPALPSPSTLQVSSHSSLTSVTRLQHVGSVHMALEARVYMAADDDDGLSELEAHLQPDKWADARITGEACSVQRRSWH